MRVKDEEGVVGPIPKAYRNGTFLESNQHCFTVKAKMFK